MNTISAAAGLVGVDLAKTVFSICGVDGRGRVLRRQDLRREAFELWLSQLAAGTVVAMEACSGAHHWARRCQAYNLQPLIMAAQFVTPFRKGRKTKNDQADAEAIATAARQGNMRFVPVKDVDQQVRLSWHRVREGYKTESLAIGNRIRGLLAEFGVIVAQSDTALRRLLADLDAHSERLPSSRNCCAIWRITGSSCACTTTPAMHASRLTRELIADVYGCEASWVSAPLPPMRWWRRSATPASSSRVGKCQRGWAWFPSSIPAAGMRGWAESVAEGMPTCARY